MKWYMFSRDGRYEINAKKRIAAGNKVNRALDALMRRRNVSTAAQCSVGNKTVIRQRNIVGITEEK